MPKDKDKENVAPRVRFDPTSSRRKSVSVFNAPAVAPTALPSLFPGVPVAYNVPTAPITSIPTSLPAIPVQVASNTGSMTVPNQQGAPNTQPLDRCMNPSYTNYRPQAHVEAPLNNTNPQLYAAAGPPVPNTSNPYPQQATVPSQPQVQPQPQVQVQSQVQSDPSYWLQLRARFQALQQIQNQIIQMYSVSGMPASSLYAPPVNGAPNNHTHGTQVPRNQLGSWPLRHPPAVMRDRYHCEPPLHLDTIDQVIKPADLWPPTVQTRPEPDLIDQVMNCPPAQVPLRSIEFCQISTSFKIGEQAQDGFRWAVLLLPDIQAIKGITDPDPHSVVFLPSVEKQYAWLLDPCARMEGRQFLQFLGSEPYKLRRKLHFRPRLTIALTDYMIDTEQLISKMENQVKQWKDVLCCSVTGVVDPRSLALSTGNWATVLFHAMKGDLHMDILHFSELRHALGTELEVIGSRELNLPFLNAKRHMQPSQAAK